MTLGRAPRQGDLLDDITRFCDAAVGKDSIYALLHRERDRLFPDEFFADLFADVGRRSVPPSVVATVMVLQRLEGLSDREAVERFTFDARWRYAAGLGGYDSQGPIRFAHTVLVDMRERLRRSTRPDRVFEVTLRTASAAGVVGRRRVLDSTPLYDAVATMDTVTLIRSALRGLLAVAGRREAGLRAACTSGDDYASTAKPQIDWEDAAAREALIDSRARDAFGCLALLEGEQLSPEVSQAAHLLAAVVGQDLEKGEDGGFRIARRVAPDRIISTVDPEARHGHKTDARSFDGYKGHVAIDPDGEVITALAVTAGNVGDASVAAELVRDCLGFQADAAHNEPGVPFEVYGDSAYGAGSVLSDLHRGGVLAMVKVAAASAPQGRFTKDEFVIDLVARTVTCPNQVTVSYRLNPKGEGIACFRAACRGCPLRERCTASTSTKGRAIGIGPHEEHLAAGRRRQQDAAWRKSYRATRPKVERKLAHLMRRRHGGRRSRMRGRWRVAQDFAWLGAAVNLARLAVLGARSTASGGWAIGGC
ncbi:MAG TPA: IS1182 family transposase [Acidimicrobiales bacterium]|nr:IS1182 family transposase [Acidimicrobiales bacterium]